MKKWKLLIPLLSILLCVSCGKAPTVVPDNSRWVFPETREEMVRTTSDIVSVKITKTTVEQLKESDLENSEDADFFIATAKVNEVLRGDMQPGQEIELIYEGDKRNKIYEWVIYNGGYPEKGTQWLLFLTSQPCFEEMDRIFYIPIINGQYQLNDKDEITFRTDMSKQYFNEFQTVGEMKKILDTLVLE